MELMLGMHNSVDEGRTDAEGNKEFLIEITGGPKKFYNRRRRHNQLFREPKIIQSPRISDEWYQEVAAGLRQERIFQHLTQQTLAQTLHTRQSVVSQFERGKTNPSLLFLQNYAQALGRKIKMTLAD